MPIEIARQPIFCGAGRFTLNQGKGIGDKFRPDAAAVRGNPFRGEGLFLVADSRGVCEAGNLYITRE